MAEGFLPPVVAVLQADIAGYVAAMAEAQARTEAFVGSAGASLTQLDEKLTAAGVSVSRFAGEFVAADDALVRVSGSLTEAAGGARELSTAVGGLARSAGTMTDRVAGAEQALVGFDEKALAAEGSITNFGTRLTELGDEMKVLATTIAQANAELTAMGASADKAAAGQVRLRESSAAARITSDDLRASMLLAGAAVGALDVVTLKMAGAFQDQMTRLQTEAGLSDTAIQHFAGSMQGLSDRVLAAATATGTAGTDMAKALYEPVSAGLDLSQALDTVKYSAEEAKIANADLETVTTATTSTMKNFGDSVHSPEQAVADLNAIVGTGMGRMQDFAASVRNWEPTAATFGVSLNSAGAALAYMTDRGDSFATAGTKLNMVMAMMVGQTNQAGVLMQGLGLSTDQVSAATLTMQSALQTAHIRTSQLADDLRSPDGVEVALMDLKTHLEAAGLSAKAADSVMVRAFGGGRQFRGLAELIENLDQLRQKYDQIQNDSNVVHFEEQWGRVTATFQFQWEILTASLKNFAIAVGGDLLPVGGKLISMLGGLLRTITDNQTAVHMLGAAAVALAVTLPIAAISMFIARMSDAATATLLVTGKIALMAAGFDYGITHITSFTGILSLAVTGMMAWQMAAPLVGTALSLIGDAFSLAKTAIGVWIIEMIDAEGVMATLKVIGSGLMDFFTGPWGIALAVAAGALALFASGSNSATAATADLTTAIQQDAGALGDHTRAVVFNQLQQQGATDAARALGVSMRDMTDAALGNQGAIDRVNVDIDRMSHAIQTGGGAFDSWARSVGQSGITATGAVQAQGKLQDALNGTRQGVQASAQAYKDQAAAGAGATSATKQTTDATIDSATQAVAAAGSEASLADATKQTTDALSAADSAAKQLTDALALLDGGNITAEKGLIAFRDDLDKITKAFSDNGVTVDDNTAKGRANLTVVLQAISDAGTYAEAVAKQTGSTQKGTEAFQNQIGPLEAVLRQAGLTQQQVDALATTYYKVPQDLITNVSTPGLDAALANVRTYVATLSGAPRQLGATGRAYAHGGLVGYATGGLAHFPVGGQVYGPGGTTSDSIPALLSSQEYVLSAAAVSAATVPVLDALNAGNLAGAYALLGSQVDTSSSYSSAGGPGGHGATTVIVNITAQGSIYAQSDLRRDVQETVLRYTDRNNGPGWTGAFRP